MKVTNLNECEDSSDAQCTQSTDSEEESKLNGTSWNASLTDSKALPIFQVKDNVVKQVSRFDTVIFLGETGCGKSTQIPKYLLERDINRTKQIIISQPRRIAAISIAHRVAEELGEDCGVTVGYKVRFQSEISSKSKIVYATDGTLLREAISDKSLSKYGVVILDEAHERTITTDILFGVVQAAQEQRSLQNNYLKVIIMSAALDVDHFQTYFKKAPVFHIEGRHHKVDILHTKNDVQDYYFTCLTTLFNIHSEAPASEDILMFLTGQEEIEKMAHEILSISKNVDCVGPPIRVHTLYASGDPNTQLEVFAPAAPGTRKIIVATNIAETSITIPGIKYVIDSGKVKMKYYNSITGVNNLKVCTISQEQALQRAGRAGRESDGFCYRTYSVQQYEKMNKSTIPEIQRTNLSAVTLSLLAMNQNPKTFNFIDQPEIEEIQTSIQELIDLGAVVGTEELRLTECGEKMSLLPLDPRYSKLLLSAPSFNCVDEILVIIAMLSTDNIFISSHSTDTSQLLEIRRKFYSSCGDHLTYLNVFRSFNKVKLKRDWCNDNFVSFPALEFAKHIKLQLISLCNILHIQISTCGPNLDQIRKCLVSGLFKNVAILQSDKSYRTILMKQKAFIHPSSALYKSLPYCILYTELIQSSETYLKNISVIDTDWLHQYVPHFARKNKLHFSEI